MIHHEVERQPTVAHKTREFEESLANILENFRIHHEGHVLRVPRLVRSITMGEFADKYHGDINECLRGMQKERQGGEPISVDPVVKKRKWMANDDAPGPEDAECSRAPKTGSFLRLTDGHTDTQTITARITGSPSKLDALKKGKLRINKTPAAVCLQ